MLVAYRQFGKMQGLATISVILIVVTGAIGQRFVGDARSHPNWPHQMDGICGEAFSDRIIGGKNASLGQFPWLTRLFVKRACVSCRFDSLLGD